MSVGDEVDYAGPVSGRTKLVLALLSLVMVAGLALEELGELGEVGPAPGPARLVGTWRMESFRGRPPSEAGIERILVTFEEGGQASYALRLLADGPAPPGLVPGRWRLDGDRLSVRFAGDSTLESELTVLEGAGIRLEPDPVAEEALGLTGPGIYRRP